MPTTPIVNCLGQSYSEPLGYLCGTDELAHLNSSGHEAHRRHKVRRNGVDYDHMQS